MPLSALVPIGIMGGCLAAIGVGLSATQFLFIGKPRRNWCDRWKEGLFNRDEGILRFAYKNG